MPGIVGIIAREPGTSHEREVRQMLHAMQHENFYDAGMFEDSALGICVGWISHDRCPPGRLFTNEQQDIAILLAGECFGQNVDEPDEGRWLTELYERKGGAFWESLKGMFSGIVIDKRKSTIYVFNDRYGTERIYWHKQNGAFYFASEAKALLRVLPALRVLDEESVAQYLTYGCALNWRTLFRGMEMFPGGSVWSFTNGSSHEKRYFHPHDWETLPVLPEKQFEAELDHVFTTVLPAYFATSSSVGLALTGGLDTRMILACKPKSAIPLCYTFTGECRTTYDDRVAAEVAATCDLEHRLLRLEPDFFQNFASYADRTVYLSDGCYGITGAHEVYFNAKARSISPIRLTGLFGSEILRGVSTFKPSGFPSSILADDFQSLVNRVNADYRPSEVHPVTAAAFQNIPWNLFGSIAVARSQVIVRTPFIDNALVALAYQMPASLRRSPESAWRLIKRSAPALARISTDRRLEDRGFPFNLRRLAREFTFKLDYYHNDGMPGGLSRVDPIFDLVNACLPLLGKHKYLHYRSWFRKRLAPYLRAVLIDASANHCLWKPGSAAKIIDSHIRGKENWTHVISTMLTLNAIDRLLLHCNSITEGQRVSRYTFQHSRTLNDIKLRQPSSAPGRNAVSRAP